ILKCLVGSEKWNRDSSHPVYTGKRREANTEGRASKFNERFKGISSLTKK
ncbi:50S ribosomal protein L31, partial [Glaesserella parasuis]|nr:50S ribosomal protein L31 [Glaesserella parasuis]